MIDLETAKKIIKQYSTKHAGFIARVMTAQRYYLNEADILFRKREPSDDDEKPLRNADNRIPRNFHGLLVDQKTVYAFTSPPSFDVGSQTANNKVAEKLGDEFAQNCMELCINAANAGTGWVHYWQGEGGFEWSVVPSEEVWPIFDKGLKRKLLAVLRIYQEFDENDGNEYAVYEYWTDKECQAFRRRTSDTIEDGLMWFSRFTSPYDTGGMIAEYVHGLEEVPFIPFWNNNRHTDDLKNIKKLIDVYDKVYSGFINDLDDVQELIFVLTGYGGENLNEFLTNLKKYKVIKLNDDGMSDKSGLDTLSIEIPIDARNSVLEATRKAIFEQGQGFDPQPENFGNQSGVALKFMYAMLEMKVGMMEAQFRTGFNKLIRAICRSEGIACEKVIQSWYRTSIRNDLEQSQICRESVGIVSDRTILENHPLVEDVDEELERLKKQKEEEQEQYGNMFTVTENGDPGDDA